MRGNRANRFQVFGQITAHFHKTRSDVMWNLLFPGQFRNRTLFVFPLVETLVFVLVIFGIAEHQKALFAAPKLHDHSLMLKNDGLLIATVRAGAILLGGMLANQIEGKGQFSHGP